MANRFKFIGTLIKATEKGAKSTVKFVDDFGKVAKGSVCKLEGLSTKGTKVLSRPIAEEKKAAAFAKKHGGVTFTNAAGKEQTRFSYVNGKIMDHKLGDTISPRLFPNRLADAKLKQAEKLVKEAKTAGKTAEEVQKKTFLGKAASFAGKNSNAVIKLTGWGALGALFAYGKISGEGMLRPIFGAVSGDSGLVNEVGEGVFGKKDYATIKDTLGSLQNEVKDIYGRGKNTVGDVGDEIASLYYKMKEAGGDGADEIKNLYQSLVHGQYSGNGQTFDDQGNPLGDPTTEQYPQLVTGDVSTMLKRLSNSVSGNQVSKLDIVSLMASAYLMFGRFGMMGKIASLVLGGTTLNKMNNRSSLSPEQIQQLRDYQRLKQLQQGSQNTESQSAPVESRSRGL